MELDDLDGWEELPSGPPHVRFGTSPDGQYVCLGLIDYGVKAAIYDTESRQIVIIPDGLNGAVWKSDSEILAVTGGALERRTWPDWKLVASYAVQLPGELGEIAVAKDADVCVLSTWDQGESGFIAVSWDDDTFTQSPPFMAWDSPLTGPLGISSDGKFVVVPFMDDILGGTAGPNTFDRYRIGQVVWMDLETRSIQLWELSASDEPRSRQPISGPPEIDEPASSTNELLSWAATGARTFRIRLTTGELLRFDAGR